MTQATPPDGAQDQPSGGSAPNLDLKPVLPAQSREDTDAGWGEWPDPDDTERLRRERPPHWE
jgi:hypothetical protein